MLNKINVKKYTTHNCIENCIANLCDYFKIDFRPLFLFSWDFGYKPETEILENSIHLNYECKAHINNYLKISRDYLGLSLLEIGCDSNGIMEYYKNKSIGLISSDAYCLPWSLAYRKYHIPHSFLAAYDDVKQKFYIIDSFSSKKILEFKTLESVKIESFYSIQKKKTSVVTSNFSILKKKYIEYLYYRNEKKVFSAIINMCKDLEKVDCITKLTERQEDLANSLLVRRLSDIVNARYNTLAFFEYLQLPYEFCASMIEITYKWETIKNVFIKILITSDLKYILKIRQELLDVEKLESSLCRLIVEEFNKNEDYK